VVGSQAIPFGMFRVTVCGEEKRTNQLLRIVIKIDRIADFSVSECERESGTKCKKIERKLDR